MTLPPALTPAHQMAEDRVRNAFPDEDAWRAEDLREVIEIALSEPIKDLLNAIERMRDAETALLLFGWSPPYYATNPVGKAFLEGYLIWASKHNEMNPGFLDATTHESLLSMVPELAAAFERRQAAKPAVPAPPKLILPGQ